MSLFDLTGKSIIITAGASYLGRAMAEAVAEFGAQIAITSRNLTKAQAVATMLSDGYGVEALGLSMDLDDDESIWKMVSDTVSAFGKVDVLINNASYSRPAPFIDMTAELWETGMRGTAGGMFKAVKAALDVMIVQESGNIINISSIYGVVAPEPGLYRETLPNPANYGAGKAAVIQLTKYIACFYGEKGVRANCICPGAFPNEYQNAEFVSRLASKTPLHRVGRPNDLKGITVLLASDASSYITGQNYIVDGGWTAW